MQKSSRSAAAGVAGAIIGAGVTAAAVALSDKSTRKKVKLGILNAQKKAGDVIHNVRTIANETADDVKEIAEKEKEIMDDASVKVENRLRESD